MTDFWYGRLPRRLHLDYHEPDWMDGIAEAMTDEYARQQAQMFRAAGVQSVSFFLHDHYGHSFFPTQRGKPHPHLARDYAGAMVKALHAEGLKAVGYFCVFTHIYIGQQHPDWLITNADGSHPAGAWLQHEASAVCPSSPYLREYMLPLIAEALSLYELDGIWLDGGSWLSEILCACTYCRDQFKAASGMELPTHPQEHHAEPWSSRDSNEESEQWIAWSIWRRGQVQRYLASVVDTARALRPALLIADNGCGRWTNPLPLTQNGRFVRWLSPDELPVDFLSSDPVPSGDDHVLILSRAGRYQTTTGKPFDFMNERFHQWGEWQLRSTTDLKLEFAAILTAGGTCNFADQPYPDGTLEPAAYDALREAYTFVQEREQFTLGSQMIPEVAILASGPSQIFGPRGNGLETARAWGSVDNGTTGKRTDRVEGAHLLCIEAGLQCLLYDEPTLRRTLDQQSLVIIAEQCLLEDATISALQQYVHHGGRLIVTGRSGWWDEQYHWRGPGRLADLLGLDIVGEHPAPLSYLRLSSQLRQQGQLPDIPLQLWGKAVRIQTRSAQILADLLPPRQDVWRDGIQDRAHWQHYTTNGTCPPARESAGPAITLHQAGKGRVAFVAIDPFASYRHDGQALIRKMMQALFELVLPANERKLQAKRPLHLELSLQRLGQTTIVHLLNYFAQRQTSMQIHAEEIPAVRDITLQIQAERAPEHVTLEPGDQPLQWSYDRHTVTVHVPEIHIHAMVVLH